MKILGFKLTWKRTMIGFGIFVLLIAGILWFYSSYNSFEAKFARSKPSLEAYALQVMASDSSKPIIPPPPRLGAFDTGRAERLANGFLVFLDYGHWLDANGVAYSTVPLPAVDANGHDFFTHIEGNWYQINRN